MGELGAYQEFLDLLSALSAILDDTAGNGLGKCIKDHTSPTLDFHNVMICGWPGGEAMPPHARMLVGDRLDDPDLTRPRRPRRHRQVLGTIPARFHAENSTTEGYHGPGAYTGAVIASPTEDDATFVSTTQCLGINNVAHRWTGTNGQINGAHTPRPGGFGTAPGTPIVGYPHGMNFAMRDALATSPTAIPIEIASGNRTTKLASCFGCTTYMWANGFPPSATHLGSALSWHPLDPGQENDPMKRAIVEAMNVRYHLQVHGYLLRGAEILADASQRSGGNRQYYVTPTHGRIARHLLRLQRLRRANAHQIGANYFLDACMDHQNDKIRLRRVILSHFDGRNPRLYDKTGWRPGNNRELF
ncbi:MAG: hypothetical protein AB1Z98_08725 [Nannocystaceae bacterium]